MGRRGTGLGRVGVSACRANRIDFLTLWCARNRPQPGRAGNCTTWSAPLDLPIGGISKCFSAHICRVPGKHFNWSSAFLLASWYGWRKMYAQSALSAVRLGFTFAGVGVLAVWASARFNLGVIAYLFWFGNIIYEVRKFGFGTVNKYKEFVARRLERLIDESTTPDRAVNRSIRAGGTSILGLLLPIIPAYIGLIVGILAAGLWIDWMQKMIGTGESAPTPATWALSTQKYEGSSDHNAHFLSIDNGKQDGIDLVIAIRGVTQGITPAQTIELLRLQMFRSPQ
jgi:hypothetical protein